MTLIKTVKKDDATGRLKTLYDRIQGPDGRVDNILMAHSLRPHSLEGHMALYKNVLHHNKNTLPKWFLETIGVYVSLLNQCAYCVDHHFSGLQRLLNNERRADALKTALDQAAQGGELVCDDLTDKEILALGYVRRLTNAPNDINDADITSLRAHGFSDGEILEINQVTAYFAYANRTVLGLGVTTDGDTLGLSPNNSDNHDDWSHQ